MHAQAELLNVLDIVLIFSELSCFFYLQCTPLVLLNLARLENGPVQPESSHGWQCSTQFPQSCDLPALPPPSSLTGPAGGEMRCVLTFLSPGWSSGSVWGVLVEFFFSNPSPELWVFCSSGFQSASPPVGQLGNRIFNVKQQWTLPHVLSFAKASIVIIIISIIIVIVVVVILIL